MVEKDNNNTIKKVTLLKVINNELKEGMKKYVLYSLTCHIKEIQGNKEIENQIILKKRYSDFFTLRKKLVQRWPGVYIPNIPPKKAIGNLDNSIIETRQRILNKFCEKLISISYLSESEEVLKFVTSNDSSKELEKLPGLKPEEILFKYQKAIKDYYEAYDLKFGKEKLDKFKELLTSIETTIKNFKDYAFASYTKKDEENKSFNNFIIKLKEYENLKLSASQNVLSVEINNIQKEIKNPYKDMKDWLEEEKLDIDAMLEALQSLDELVKKFEACCDSNESVSKNIQSIQYGGRYNKVMQFFRKSENNLEEEKKNNERYIAILYEIIKLASFNMEFYLKNFKEEKIKDYYKTLKTFILDSNNNLQQNKQLWDTISKEVEQKVQVNRKESNDSNNIIN